MKDEWVTAPADHGTSIAIPTGDSSDSEWVTAPAGHAALPPPPSEPVVGAREKPLDDTKFGAGAGTIARVSLAPDEHVQMKRYAEAFKQPMSDFGIIDGHIVRKVPETGQYARVQPSVRGGNGVLDTAERAMDWVASGAGPAIPAVTSAAGAAAAAILATPATAGVGALPAAMAGGSAGAMAGETARQKLDHILAPDGDKTDYDLENIGWQGAAGAAGPIAGKIIEGVGGRVAPVLKNAIADELPVGAVAERAAISEGTSPVAATASSFGLSPRVEAALKEHITGKDTELAALRKDAQDMGIDLSLGQLTGSKAVQQSERQLIRQPETVQAVADMRTAQNEQQIPGAVRKVMDEVAPETSAGQQVGEFRDAAGKVIEKTFKEQSKAAKPVYGAALDNKEPFWSDELTDIMKRPSVQAGWREAQKDAAEEGRSLPELFSKASDDTLSLNEQNVSWRDWQNIKIGMRKAVEAETDETTGKMTPDGRRIKNTLSDMMGVLYKANPEWKAADIKYGSASDVTDAVLEGGVGFLNKMSGADRQNMVNRVFSGQNLMPEEVDAMRRQFVYAGKSAEWLGGVRSYIADKLADAMVPNQTGELSNVGGKVYQSLWGDQRQVDIIKAAFGGSANDSFIRQWDKLGNVMRAAARQLPEGSPTATDTAAPGLMSKAVGAVKAVMHPTATGADLIEGLTKIKDPEQAKKLAETLLTPEGDKLLKSLAPVTPGTPMANNILLKILTQAGVITAVEKVRGDEAK